MNVEENRFTIRQVAAVLGEKVPTIQSWADKGWARITPARGPGQARELSIVDVYLLSIACEFKRIGVEPQRANEIAASAIYDGTTRKRATERAYAEVGETLDSYFAGSPERAMRPAPKVTLQRSDLHPAFTDRDADDPYHLLVRAGRVLVGEYISAFPVELIRLRSVEPAKLVDGALSDLGFFINITELLTLVDAELARIS